MNTKTFLTLLLLVLCVLGVASLVSAYRLQGEQPQAVGEIVGERGIWCHGGDDFAVKGKASKRSDCYLPIETEENKNGDQCLEDTLAGEVTQCTGELDAAGKCQQSAEKTYNFKLKPGEAANCLELASTNCLATEIKISCRLRTNQKVEAISNISCRPDFLCRPQ